MRGYIFFHFLPGPSRVHMAGWDANKGEWRVVCGLVPRSSPAGIHLDAPLCKTCNDLTRQLTTEDSRR